MAQVEVREDGGSRSDGRPWVPQRAQEAGGSLHAGPLQARTRHLPDRVGWLLRSRLVRLAATPHEVDHYLRLVNPLWSVDGHRALLVDHHRETHDVSTLVLEPDPDWGPHEAGQHVQVRVEIDGRRRTRHFSISSGAHRDDGRITLTVKAHDDGFASRFLHTHARPGLVLEVSEPRGEFVLPDPRPDHLLLVSGGSGVTPLMSMLRTLVAEGHRGRVTFVHYARTPQDRIFGDELDDLARDHPWLTVRTVYSRGERPAEELSGHIEHGHLDAIDPDWDSVPAFVCGPPGMLAAAERIWEAAGAADDFHIERFTLQQPSADDDAEGRIHLTRSGIEFDNDGRPLLLQAEEAGLEPEYGCRLGICKTCTTHKVSGVTQNLSNDDVSREDDEDIQICVAIAHGDVELDL